MSFFPLKLIVYFKIFAIVSDAEELPNKDSNKISSLWAVESVQKYKG